MDKIEVTRPISDIERDILATRTDTTPVALAHISLEDDGPYIDLQVLNGETLQPADKPVPLYTHPPATDAAALVERDQKFCRIVWDALKGDHTDLKRQQIILEAFRSALAPFTKGQP